MKRLLLSSLILAVLVNAEQFGDLGDFIDYVDPATGRSTTVHFERTLPAGVTRPRAVVLPYFIITEMKAYIGTSPGTNKGILQFSYSTVNPNPIDVQSHFLAVDSEYYNAFEFSNAPTGRFSFTIPSIGGRTINSTNVIGDSRTVELIVSGDELDNLKLMIEAGFTPGIDFNYLPWLRTTDYTVFRVERSHVERALSEAISEVRSSDFGGSGKALIYGVAVAINGSIRKQIGETLQTNNIDVNSNIEILLNYNTPNPLQDVDLAKIFEQFVETLPEIDTVPAGVPVLNPSHADRDDQATAVQNQANVPEVALAYTNSQNQQKYKLINSRSFFQRINVMKIRTRAADDITISCQPQGYLRKVFHLPFFLTKHHQAGYWVDRGNERIGLPGTLTATLTIGPSAMAALSGIQAPIYYRCTGLVDNYLKPYIARDFESWGHNQSDYGPGGSGKLEVTVVPWVLRYRRPQPAELGGIAPRSSLAKATLSDGSAQIDLELTGTEHSWPSGWKKDNLNVRIDINEQYIGTSAQTYISDFYGVDDHHHLNRSDFARRQNSYQYETSDSYTISGVLWVYTKDRIALQH